MEIPICQFGMAISRLGKIVIIYSHHYPLDFMMSSFFEILDK